MDGLGVPDRTGRGRRVHPPVRSALDRWFRLPEKVGDRGSLWV